MEQIIKSTWTTLMHIVYIPEEPYVAPNFCYLFKPKQNAASKNILNV